MATPIITLAEYKALQGIQAGAVKDDTQIGALLPAASRAIRAYTGRSFEPTTGVATDRSFQYDESGFLDIDDAVAVTTVTTDVGVAGQPYTFQGSEWTAMPQDDSDVFYYLLVHSGPLYGPSPLMGFQRNLDKLPYQDRSPLLTVTAQWGWPEIPADVKLATALTVGELVSSPGKSEGLTSESIEGFARAWGGRAGSTQATAVPQRARDLLASYQRIFV